MADWGVLAPGQYLIHDRDGKYCPAFQRILDAAGVRRVPLPPGSPNLNAYAERWIRSIQDDALSRQILFGERALWYVLTEYGVHYTTWKVMSQISDTLKNSCFEIKGLRKQH
jgi:transposase InsO family protein